MRRLLGFLLLLTCLGGSVTAVSLSKISAADVCYFDLIDVTTREGYADVKGDDEFEDTRFAVAFELFNIRAEELGQYCRYHVATDIDITYVRDKGKDSHVDISASVALHDWDTDQDAMWYSKDLKLPIGTSPQAVKAAAFKLLEATVSDFLTDWKMTHP